MVQRRLDKGVQPKRVEAQRIGKKKLRRPVAKKDIVLTEFYQKTGIVLLPVDPHLVYAYWDIAREDLERAKHKLSEEFNGAQAALRFHDLTDTVGAETRSGNYFDLDVDFTARSLFVPLWSAGRTYQVELGLRAQDGRFLSLAFSNIVGDPPSSAEGKTEERYLRVSEDSGIVEISEASVSPESGRPSSVGEPSTMKTDHSRTPATEGKETAARETVSQRLGSIPPALKTSIVPPDRDATAGKRRMWPKPEGNSGKRQSLSSQPVLQRKLFELAGFRRAHLSQEGEASAAVQDVCVPPVTTNRKLSPDLTAWCVTQFVFGTSSERRSRKKE